MLSYFSFNTHISVFVFFNNVLIITNITYTAFQLQRYIGVAISLALVVFEVLFTLVSFQILNMLSVVLL